METGEDSYLLSSSGSPSQHVAKVTYQHVLMDGIIPKLRLVMNTTNCIDVSLSMGIPVEHCLKAASAEGWGALELPCEPSW